jgi:hypothetical protein
MRLGERPRMSCLAEERPESKTFSPFLRTTLTHSGLYVLRVRGFRVVAGACGAGSTITGGGVLTAA